MKEYESAVMLDLTESPLKSFSKKEIFQKYYTNFIYYRCKTNYKYLIKGIKKPLPKVRVF